MKKTLKKTCLDVLIQDLCYRHFRWNPGSNESVVEDLGAFTVES